MDQLIAETLRTGEPLRGELTLSDSENNTERRVEVSAVPIKEAGDGTTGAVVLFHDITELKRLDQIRSDFVANVSHELRTPLASMRVLVDGLLADATVDPIKTREYLEMIASENARLSRLIENFLTFSRLERDSYRFEFAPTSPSAVVASAANAIRDRLPPGGDLRVDVAPGLPDVMADADALSTALINLLDNALKYTPEEKRILVRVRRDGDAAVSFAVEDNGIGIPMKEQRRIFKRFYRVDQRLTRETTGVGLGLSIVELIVRAHGGTVTVSSAPGSGSTFALRLPSAGARATA